jgi:hypothetical protein
MAEGTNEQRKSRIKKTIKRQFFEKSINVPKYESVTVEVSFEEDIEWNTLAERAKKSENITELLKRDYSKTVKDVFKKYGYKKGNAGVAVSESDGVTAPANNQDPQLADMDGLAKG